MKKPDPNRFTKKSRGKYKPDELEMKGFSAPSFDETDEGRAKKAPPPSPASDDKSQSHRRTESQSNRPTELQTDRVTDSQSDRVTESVTNRLTDFTDYNVPDYRKLKRVELRLTHEQNRFLDDLEAAIARERPEGSRSDPDYRRITKNSIVRALVEVARRLHLRPDVRGLNNEQDLGRAVAEEIRNRLTELQSNRVTESGSDRERE